MGLNGLLLTLFLFAMTTRQQRKPFQRLKQLRGGASKAKVAKSRVDRPHDFILSHPRNSSEVNSPCTQLKCS